MSSMIDWIDRVWYASGVDQVMSHLEDVDLRVRVEGNDDLVRWTSLA
jgi:hypothetical protein